MRKDAPALVLRTLEGEETDWIGLLWPPDDETSLFTPVRIPWPTEVYAGREVIRMVEPEAVRFDLICEQDVTPAIWGTDATDEQLERVSPKLFQRLPLREPPQLTHLVERKP